MGVAIVAIPSENDYVWRLSSEKVPHLTLLFLGDNVENLQRVEEYVGHVVNTSASKFGMDVERRGVLGDQEADVLFFGEYSRKRMEDVRRYLLDDADIQKAYNSADQFPEWIPHLTLGYPETPAKPDDRDYPGISWVNFDRIALWTGQYEGVEFPLKNDEQLSMSDRGEEFFLEHFGVKGMKWGVRRSEQRAGKADQKWTKKSSSPKSLQRVHGSATRRMNRDEIGRLNNKPEYKDKDFSTDSPLRRKYYKEYEKTFMRVMNEESDKVLGRSPDGKHRVAVESSDNGNSLNFVVREIKHADGDVIFVAKKNDRGYIISIEMVTNDLTQSSPDDVEDFLEHYGIKGMKWGVRRDAAVSGAKKVGKEAYNYIKPSVDAKKAGAVKQKAKIAGVDALTNQDLQSLITRMNLERQFKELKQVEQADSYVGKGKKWAGNFVNDVLKDAASSWLKRPGSNFSGRTSGTAYSWGQQVAGAIEGTPRRRAIGS